MAEGKLDPEFHLQYLQSGLGDRHWGRGQLAWEEGLASVGFVGGCGGWAWVAGSTFGAKELLGRWQQVPTTPPMWSRGVKEEEHALGEQRKWMALALALGRQEVKGGGSPGGIWL